MASASVCLCVCLCVIFGESQCIRCHHKPVLFFSLHFVMSAVSLKIHYYINRLIAAHTTNTTNTLTLQAHSRNFCGGSKPTGKRRRKIL